MKKKVVEPPKAPKTTEFVTYALYQLKTKKFLCAVEYAKTGRPIRRYSDKYFMTFATIDEAKAAFEAAECTSGMRIVEVKFAI